jgi:hypothetical protein
MFSAGREAMERGATDTGNPVISPVIDGGTVGTPVEVVEAAEQLPFACDTSGFRPGKTPDRLHPRM